MKLSEYSFFADENIGPEVVATLRANGQDIISTVEAGLQGHPDVEVLISAVGAGRVILTHDPDFGELAVAWGRPVVGIVLLRPGHIQSEFTLGSIEAAFREVLDIRAPFIVVVQRVGEEVAIRVRRLRD